MYDSVGYIYWMKNYNFQSVCCYYMMSCRVDLYQMQQFINAVSVVDDIVQNTVGLLYLYGKSIV